MRVIYLHQYFNTPDMAGGTRSYEMARRLAAAGHEVNMVTTWREPTDKCDWFATEEAGIKVHWLPVLYSNHMSYAKRVRAFIHFAWAAARKSISLPGDVVFATSTPLTIALPAIWASRLKRVPMVFEVRDLWPEVPIAMGVLRNPVAIRLAYLLESIAYRMSSRVIALAPGMKTAVSDHGIAGERVIVIPNGCDFDLFDTGNTKPIVYPHAELGDKSIVYIGTMGSANGVDYIVRLAYEIHRRSNTVKVRFYLVGDGSQRAQVESLAADLGVLNAGVYFIGMLSKRDVAHWVASADATILTYDGPEIVFRDSVSNKFFDSIAASKPVIANFAGFSTLTAAEAGAGFIISRNPVMAAEEVLDLVSDPEILAKAGKAAGILARERFSRDELAGQLEQVLLGVVREGRHCPSKLDP